MSTYLRSFSCRTKCTLILNVVHLPCIIAAPVYIEELNPSDPQTVVYDDKTFEISCTASGSNINKVTWYKDGQPLDGKNNFRIWEVETVEGTLEYGQTQAVESFLERQLKSKL